MRDFDINLAKQGKPVCTRDGRKARIICFDAKSVGPIFALIDNGDNEEIHLYNDDGKIYECHESNEDLMMALEKKEGWMAIFKQVNIYNMVYTSNIYEDKEDLRKYVISRNSNNIAAIVKVEWEE